MKIKTLAAACALATLGTAACAQSYLGVGIGATNACVARDTAGDCADNGKTGKLLLGYAFPGTDFAIESTYTHMGSFKAGSTQGSTRAKVDMLGVGGAWRPQFGAGFGGVLRGGVVAGKVKSDFSAVQLGTPDTTVTRSDSTGFWQPYVGVGATYAITSKISLEADLDLTRVKPSQAPVTARTFMVGATFGF